MILAVAYFVTGLLVAASAGLLAFWGAVHFQIWRTSLRVPTARRGISLARREAGNDDSNLPSVCVVIPAHNEAKIIGELVASLRLQDYPRLRFVFALDRCKDRTRAVIEEIAAGDSRFEIIEITSCPEHWAGKVHALWTGVNSSQSARDAQILLFADADTTFSSSCVHATVALMRERSLGLLSLLSTLSHDTWYERVVQPAAAFELVHQYPMVQANRDRPRRPFANGQFLMMTREAYWQIGGHEAVKEELLEDLAIARHAAEKNVRMGVFLADGVMRCRMYPDWKAFRRGWKRIFTEGFQRRVSRLRKGARLVRLTGSILPILTMLLFLAWAIVTLPLERSIDIWPAYVAGTALVVWITALIRVYHQGQSPLWAVILNPIGAWVVADILMEAARDLETGTPTVWGGKAYARPVR